MRREIVRALVGAILATVILGGCTRPSEVLSSKTPEQLRQLSEVTDRIVLLVRSASAGDGASSEKRTAIQQAVAAIAAADPQFEQHSEALNSLENAEALACIRAEAMTMLDLDTLLGRLDEARQQGDEVTVKRREAALVLRAMEASRCAIQGAGRLTFGKRSHEELEHAAVLISEIYAVGVVLRVAAGLQSAALLRDEIRTLESILATIGATQDVPFITETLAKLRTVSPA